MYEYGSWGAVGVIAMGGGGATIITLGMGKGGGVDIIMGGAGATAGVKLEKKMSSLTLPNPFCWNDENADNAALLTWPDDADLARLSALL